MELNLSDANLILGKTPAYLDLALRDLPNEWLRANEGKDTWSCYDVVGHLIHGERTDWMPRIEIILEHGANRPFVPFDRFAQLRRDQSIAIGELLDEFTSLRRQNLQRLANLHLTAEDWSKPGMHPELGGVTLGELISTWVVHDLTHLNQINRVMAKQYSETVGPWKQYLSILTR
jgi:DinB superfamily